MSFKGKVVLITGAGAGIGKATAERFAAEGAGVVVNSLSVSAAKTAEGLAKSGHPVLFVQADVSKEADAERLVAETVTRFGGLDVLVNCAGIVLGGTIEDTTLADWQRTMETNATGVFLVSRAAIPHLRARGGGAIVNVSSVAAVKGVINRAAYSASKGALISLTKSMAADLIKYGIRVNSVSPGTVHTPSLDQRIASSPDPEQALKDFIARQPMKRLGKSEEIAAAILFAADEDAGFLNGANILIDGAMSL
ncbi:MAG: glucose 1-dehydrogenase [Methylobacteriaceae bacterium]|jgi:NAD(P)-dependent dehydrogenase (short-subunit alcohol dehydrogenase family)|nr:glucose 1-dehydrogenase [Methylobacteriaceae bacterium]